MLNFARPGCGRGRSLCGRMRGKSAVCRNLLAVSCLSVSRVVSVFCLYSERTSSARQYGLFGSVVQAIRDGEIGFYRFRKSLFGTCCGCKRAVCVDIPGFLWLSPAPGASGLRNCFVNIFYLPSCIFMQFAHVRPVIRLSVPMLLRALWRLLVAGGWQCRMLHKIMCSVPNRCVKM